MMNNSKTKYPVLLVHGFGFRDDFPIIKYWGKIPEVFSNTGTKLFLSNHDAFGTIETNANFILQKIETILENERANKVNIIAHSKGGIDCRFIISSLKQSEKVASLTTISTPHRGTYLADFTITKAANLAPGSKAANSLAKVLGDLSPDLLSALQSLTIPAMKLFNQNNPDSPSVFYQSYSSCISNTYLNPFLLWTSKLLMDVEGINDGIVSVESSKWGSNFSLLGGEEKESISHFDIVGQGINPRHKKFNVENFYKEIIFQLSHKGF